MIRRLVILSSLAIGIFATGCESSGELKINSVEPKSVGMQGAKRVAIHGSGFRTDIAYSVYFGAARAQQVTVADPNTMYVLAPAGKAAGPTDILITPDDGERLKLVQAFTYTEKGAATKPAGPANALPY